MEVNTSKIF